MTTFENLVTDAARNEMYGVATNISSIVTNVNGGSDPIQAANTLAAIRDWLVQARNMQFDDLSTSKGATFDALLAQLQSVATARANYQQSPTAGNLTTLKAAIASLSTPNSNFSTMLGTLSKSWSIQDRVFYEYSKAGEAELNNQLGQLGDALDSLAQVIDVVNKIELALSINPVNSQNVAQVGTDGSLTSDYYTQAPNSLMLSTPEGTINAAQYVYNARQQLQVLMNNFPSGSTLRNEISTAINNLDGAGVNSWNNASNPPTNTNNIWSDKFKKFWENSNLRQSINNLQTTLSSQNDVQKQNLRQAMFIYQEFVKSASLVMDRVYDVVKDIASRISR